MTLKWPKWPDSCFLYSTIIPRKAWCQVSWWVLKIHTRGKLWLISLFVLRRTPEQFHVKNVGQHYVRENHTEPVQRVMISNSFLLDLFHVSISLVFSALHRFMWQRQDPEWNPRSSADCCKTSPRMSCSWDPSSHADLLCCTGTLTTMTQSTEFIYCI